MANPSVQTIINRSRQQLNQVGQKLHNENEYIKYVSLAGQAQYRFVLKILESEGKPVDKAHHYMRHFARLDSKNTEVNKQDYNFDATHERTLSISYGKPLRLVHRVSTEEEAIAELSRLFGASRSRAAWMHRPSTAANNAFRLWVVPGRQGIPQSIVPYAVWYLKRPTRFTTVVELMDVPEEYTEGIVWKASALAVVKERKVSEMFEQLAQQAWSVIT